MIGRSDPPDSASPDRHHQLAEVAAFFHPRKDLGDVRPGKILAHGPHLREGYGLVHIQEILPRSDINSLNAGLLVQDGRQGQGLTRS